MDENVVQINLKPFEDMMGRLPQKVLTAARREAKTQLGVVQKTAKTFHRFMNTSGRRPSGRYYKNTHRLERSISMEMSDTTGRVYLDLGIADYGVYVHQGWWNPKTGAIWYPDQFIYEAMHILKPDIVREIGNAVYAAAYNQER